MCGRYALGVRMNFIRHRLQEQGMPVDEAPDGDEVRETYNFAPGNIGAIYRADFDIPNRDADDHHENDAPDPTEPAESSTDTDSGSTTHYKLQGMKWGLVPFWTQRQPDYGSLMRTINCRDDSLIDDRGMWTSMKRRKRCVVVCQGYFEWLKRGPGGKDKIPHFTRRNDGDLMYFAGLWDSVTYQGSEEKLYTYTIITTSARPSLSWLHDRMPVILDPGSEAWKIWLDPSRTSWSKELQGVLKSYEGDLECYQVPKEVGKVGNNSPDFLVPVDSKENKNNIANFFTNAKKKTEPGVGPEQMETNKDADIKQEDESTQLGSGVKREHPDDIGRVGDEDAKKQKIQSTPVSSPKKPPQYSIPKQRQTRSATQNKKPVKKVEPKKSGAGTQRITNFFSK
ncbi:hypothetical protein BDW59DRAFT_67856 [Aspergillus cavernicola]|uniref:DUF159 domain protein n=1 Tax=Aspergillus cavernicola TaxID=176166 RepID=A0ABR4IED2_9EURO